MINICKTLLTWQVTHQNLYNCHANNVKIWTCYHFPFYVNNEEKYLIFVLKTYISQEFIFSGRKLMMLNMACACARAHAWKFSRSKVRLILNISCFESMLIFLKTTKVCITIDSRKNMKKWWFFRNPKNMMLNIARACARARLKIFPIESLIDFEHFLFWKYVHISQNKENIRNRRPPPKTPKTGGGGLTS